MAREVAMVSISASTREPLAEVAAAAAADQGVEVHQRASLPVSSRSMRTNRWSTK
jgi:hypothetical protein